MYNLQRKRLLPEFAWTNITVIKNKVYKEKGLIYFKYFSPFLYFISLIFFSISLFLII